MLWLTVMLKGQPVGRQRSFYPKLWTKKGKVIGTNKNLGAWQGYCTGSRIRGPWFNFQVVCGFVFHPRRITIVTIAKRVSLTPSMGAYGCKQEVPSRRTWSQKLKGPIPAQSWNWLGYKKKVSGIFHLWGGVANTTQWQPKPWSTEQPWWQEEQAIKNW